MPAPSRITDAEWQKHKAAIRRLYMVENRTLDFVMREMFSTHGFSASKYQYTTRLNKWEMKKNAEHETWSSISGALKRRCIDVSGANVFLNDQLVPRKKLKKELQRYTAQEDALTVTTPEGITIQPILEHIRKQRCVIPGSLSISLPWHALIKSWILNWSLANASPAALSASSSVRIDSSGWTWPSPKSYNATFSYGMSPHVRGGSLEPPTFVDTGIADLLGPEANEIVGCFGLGTWRLGREKEHLKQHLRRFLIEGKLGETQSAINDLMGPYSIASMKLLTAYMALMLSNDLVPDDGVQAFLVKAEELHCLGNLTPIFSQASPSARAFSTQILHAAVRMNNTKFLRQALKYGADVESPSTGEQSSTLLQEALKRGQHEAARLLIDAGANVNAGATASYRMKACQWNLQHVETIMCICEEKGSIHPVVALAAKSNACLSLIPELLSKGARISKRDPILLYAIDAGASVDMITYLINAGADINLCSSFYKLNTPLSVATQRGSLEIVHALLKAGANPNGPLDSELSLACAQVSFLMRTISPLLCVIKDPTVSAKNCFNIVQLLLEYGADPNISVLEVLERKHGAELFLDHVQPYWYHDENPRPSYPLEAAVYSSNIELVMLLLQHKASTNQSYGTPALALAILFSNAKIVYLLLEHGADPNGLSKQSYCQSALEAAVDKKNVEALDLLLQFGGDINNGPAPYGGRTPLQRAAENGDERMVAYLLEHGASILSQSAPFRGVSVLQGFVRNGLHTYISKAIKAGACLDPALSRYATSPLATAVIHKDAVSLELLLDAGANIEQYACIDCRDEHEGRPRSMLFNSRVSHFSPIQWAARMNHIEIARILCEEGADVNQTPHIPDGGTALYIAIECGNYEIAKFLVEQNADVGAYSNGETSLFAAIKTCNLSFLDLLLENGADPNQACTNEDSTSLTPLDKACEHGESSIVRSLLCARADTSQGYAVQKLAEAYNPDSALEILEMLLQYGGDVNKRCLSWHTALQKAILSKHFHYVDRLIEAGADINAPPSNVCVWAPFNFWGGRTALQAAVEVGNIDMVDRLLVLGADVNAPAAPDHGVTALQAAAIKGYLNIAKILLEHGAVIDAAASPENGCTAINGAAEFGRIDMVKLLLDNYHGPTPISELRDDAYRAAKKGNQWYVIELLDAYKHPDEVSP